MQIAVVCVFFILLLVNVSLSLNTNVYWIYVSYVCLVCACVGVWFAHTARRGIELRELHRAIIITLSSHPRRCSRIYQSCFLPCCVTSPPVLLNLEQPQRSLFIRLHKIYSNLFSQRLSLHFFPFFKRIFKRPESVFDNLSRRIFVSMFHCWIKKNKIRSDFRSFFRAFFLSVLQEFQFYQFFSFLLNLFFFYCSQICVLILFYFSFHQWSRVFSVKFVITTRSKSMKNYRNWLFYLSRGRTTINAVLTFFFVSSPFNLLFFPFIISRRSGGTYLLWRFIVNWNFRDRYRTFYYVDWEIPASHENLRRVENKKKIIAASRCVKIFIVTKLWREILWNNSNQRSPRTHLELTFEILFRTNAKAVTSLTMWQWLFIHWRVF